MAKKPFQFPVVRGSYSRQAHVKIPEGTFEEEVGREGFFGAATHLYHQNPPTGWKLIEGDCRPQAFDFNKLETTKGLHVQRLLHNRSVSISMARSQEADPFYSRNADGDEIHFIHEGSGKVETDFGALNYTVGDYLYIPRATNYRFLGKGPQRRLVIEATNNYFFTPDRGILGQHALYDPAVLELPELAPSKEGATDTARGLWQVKVKRAGRFTNLWYPYNPIDVVGLKGDLTSFKLPVAAICPVMSHRVHLAPSVHSTFVSDGFVICTFTPRPLEEEEGAVRVPFWHRNVDYDEVIFYHAGDFFSRDNIRAGWLSFHPTGVHHGPHPKAYANQYKKTRTDEYAVMIDARDPLEVDTTPAVRSCEWADYYKSWGA